ncbi:MAG TPA: hypothetical protein V6C52_08185 [Coleofasciculaceae cyanobacterium]|jgi:hypothetical protein
MQPNQPPPRPAPLLDTVTYGYKCAFKFVVPLALLCLPYYALSGLIESLKLVYPETWLHQLVSGLISLSGVWVGYATLRFIIDCCNQRPRLSLPEYYLIKAKMFWGIIGLNILGIVATVILCVTGFLGLFVLIFALAFAGKLLGVIGSPDWSVVGIAGMAVMALPLLLAFLYLRIWFDMSIILFMEAPEKGTIAALRQTVFLLKGHHWKTFVLAIVIGILAGIFFAPGFLIGACIGLIKQFSPSILIKAWWMPVLLGSTLAITFTFNYIGSYCAGVFAIYRYITDLRLLSDREHEVEAFTVERGVFPNKANGEPRAYG